MRKVGTLHNTEGKERKNVRDRHGKKHENYNRSVYQSLALISQFGINMLVPIFLLSFVGMAMDRYFHTSFWMVLLFFTGALAGFRNIFLMARKIYSRPGKRRTERAQERKKADEKDQ